MLCELLLLDTALILPLPLAIAPLCGPWPLVSAKPLLPDSSLLGMGGRDGGGLHGGMALELSIAPLLARPLLVP